MGDSIAKELMQLVQGLSATITVKMSHLVDLLSRYKNAASLGAAASLAITLLWTWKFINAPTYTRRGNNTPAASVIGGSRAALGSTSSASLAAGSVVPHSQSQALQSCGSLSLAQTVRRRLQGGRKMTCQLLGVVLEEMSPSKLQQHAVVRPAVVEVLVEIARACDLYLLARVEDDDSESAVLAALEGVGMFTEGGMDRNKVLFCSSEAGASSFVRQLEPEWHVDTARERMQTLAPFVHHQLHITIPATTSTAAPIASNVFAAESLEQFFSCIS